MGKVMACASAKTHSKGGGFAKVWANAHSQGLNAAAATCSNAVAQAFADACDGSSSVAAVTSAAEACASATAKVYVSTMVRASSSGNSKACADTCGMAKASAQAVARAAASAIANATQECATVQIFVNSTAFSTAIVNANAQVLTKSCIQGKGRLWLEVGEERGVRGRGRRMRGALPVWEGEVLRVHGPRSAVCAVQVASSAASLWQQQPALTAPLHHTCPWLTPAHTLVTPPAHSPPPLGPLPSPPLAQANSMVSGLASAYAKTFAAALAKACTCDGTCSCPPLPAKARLEDLATSDTYSSVASGRRALTQSVADAAALFCDGDSIETAVKTVVDATVKVYSSALVNVQVCVRCGSWGRTRALRGACAAGAHLMAGQ